MNFVMQVALLSVCSLAAASSVAVLVFEIVKLLKGKKKVSKEEKARIKEENARKALIEQINAMNAKLVKLNTKK